MHSAAAFPELPAQAYVPSAGFDGQGAQSLPQAAVVVQATQLPDSSCCPAGQDESVQDVDAGSRFPEQMYVPPPVGQGRQSLPQALVDRQAAQVPDTA